MLSHNQPIIPRDSSYFLTFNVVDRVDVFIRPAYKQVVVDALNHFVDTQGLMVYAWCLMTSHVHLLIKTREGNGPAYFERDFKKFTTPEILKAIEMEKDPRREWMIQQFENFGKSLKKIEKFHLWQNCSSPLHIDCGQPQLLLDRIGHIHENPIRERIVELPENYLFSSARDYAGMKGLVKVKPVQMGVSKINLLSRN
jgi:REP-associated tyrosine transposase